MQDSKNENPVEHAFDEAQEIQNSFSRRWRMHVNRRTLWTIVVAATLATACYTYVLEPSNSFPTGELVTVPQVGSRMEVARILEQDGVIQNRFAFVAATLLTGRRGVIAGDYYFKEPVSVFTVARRLAFGEYGLEPQRIRIPEGMTVRAMAPLLAITLHRFDSKLIGENLLAH